MDASELLFSCLSRINLVGFSIFFVVIFGNFLIDGEKFCQRFKIEFIFASCGRYRKKKLLVERFVSFYY